MAKKTLRSKEGRVTLYSGRFQPDNDNDPSTGQGDTNLTITKGDTGIYSLAIGDFSGQIHSASADIFTTTAGTDLQARVTGIDESAGTVEITTLSGGSAADLHNDGTDTVEVLFGITNKVITGDF